MELESARRLEDKGIWHRIIELRSRAVSVSDVIQHSKETLNPEEICKTIIVKDKAGRPHALMLLGAHRVDFAKAQKAIGAAVKLATSEEVKEWTGVEPGAVCPLLLSLPVFIDRRVFEKEKINFGSGNHFYGIEMCSGDLENAIPFTQVDIAQV